MTKPVPLCIDCAHHTVVENKLDLSSVFEGGPQFHVCTRRQTTVTNPVDGSISYSGRKDCSSMRSMGADCGPSGRFFKPKAGDRA